jgi:hypothetical protein
MKIFKNQGYISIELDTEINLGGSTNPRILYKKPNGVSGEWVATVDGTTLVYEADNDTFDQVGVWLFQTKITIDGRDAFGKTVSKLIDKNIV